MADIELRLGRDMLVLSAPIDATLARQGVDVARDRQYLNLMEPDAVVDALKMELLAGAQCLVTTTEDITKARLAHVRMEGDAPRLAHAAHTLASELKPQHLLVEIGPCGLPLDTSSKASLNECRAQYADAARAFAECDFDAFFLNRFGNIADLKCALMGVAQASGKPVFASVVLGDAPAEGQTAGAASRQASAAPVAPAAQGSAAETSLFEMGLNPVDDQASTTVPVPHAQLDPALWPEALDVMAEFGAAVAGFETVLPLSRTLDFARQAVQATSLPVLAQLRVEGEGKPAAARALVPLEEREDYALDTMEHVAAKLHAAGVQFLRATGAATPAYTGVLAATVSGLDVRPRR